MGRIAQEVHLPHSSGICGSGNVMRGGGGQKDYQEVCFCESGSLRISCADKTMSMCMLTWKRKHRTGSRSWTKNYRQFMTAGRRISLSQGPAPYHCCPMQRGYTHNQNRLHKPHLYYSCAYVHVSNKNNQRTRVGDVREGCEGG